MNKFHVFMEGITIGVFMGIFIGIVLCGMAVNNSYRAVINLRETYERLYDMSYRVDDTDNFYLNIRDFDYVIGVGE